MTHFCKCSLTALFLSWWSFLNLCVILEFFLWSGSFPWYGDCSRSFLWKLGVTASANESGVQLRLATTNKQMNAFTYWFYHFEVECHCGPPSAHCACTCVCLCVSCVLSWGYKLPCHGKCWDQRQMCCVTVMWLHPDSLAGACGGFWGEGAVWQTDYSYQTNSAPDFLVNGGQCTYLCLLRLQVGNKSHTWLLNIPYNCCRHAH